MKENAVAGVVQRLPYRDNAFDETIASFSLNSVTDLNQALQEMLRVTREGGNVKINPVYPIEGHEFSTKELPLGARVVENLDPDSYLTLLIPKIAIDSGQLSLGIQTLLEQVKFRPETKSHRGNFSREKIKKIFRRFLV